MCICTQSYIPTYLSMNMNTKEHRHISWREVVLALTARLQPHAGVTCLVFIHWETFRNKTQDSNL